VRTYAATVLLTVVICTGVLHGCAASSTRPVSASREGTRGARVSPRTYADEEDDVPNTPKGPPACHAEDVEQLFVDIECEYLGNPTDQDWEAGIQLEFRRAAEVAAVSGKAFVVRLTSEAETHYLTSRNPIRCQTTVNQAKVAANVLRTFANATRRGSVNMDCATIGNNTSCSGSVTPPPRPIPLVDPRETTCSGGRTYRVVSGVTTTARYRMLSIEEGSAQDVQLLPEKDQPITVRAILAPSPPVESAAARPSPGGESPAP
jgi:hypothetical protein